MVRIIIQRHGISTCGVIICHANSHWRTAHIIVWQIRGRGNLQNIVQVGFNIRASGVIGIQLVIVCHGGRDGVGGFSRAVGIGRRQRGSRRCVNNLDAITISGEINAGIVD